MRRTCAGVVGVVLCIAAATSPTAAAGATTVLSTCGDIAPAVAGAAAGDEVVLPALTCVVTTSLKVSRATGVAVTGAPGSVLVGDFSAVANARGIFDVTGTNSASFSDFEVRLKKNAGAFRGTSGQKLQVKRLVISGNLQQEDDAAIAVHLTGFSNSTFAGNEISNSFGGIYVISSVRTTITDNTLSRVNFGNVVVSGEDITITNNLIREPGHVGTRNYASGDAITLGAGARRVTIAENIFALGFCYLVHAPQAVSDITMTRNTFAQGITSAVFMRSPARVTVDENIFTRNRAHGVALVSATDSTITRNVFIDDTVFVPDFTGGSITGNTLHGSAISGNVSATTTVEGNSTTTQP